MHHFRGVWDKNVIHKNQNCTFMENSWIPTKELSTLICFLSRTLSDILTNFRESFQLYPYFCDLVNVSWALQYCLPPCNTVLILIRNSHPLIRWKRMGMVLRDCWMSIDEEWAVNILGNSSQDFISLYHFYAI